MKYIKIFIIVFVLAVIAQSVYKQLNKQTLTAKATRLPCQKKLVSFESVFIPNQFDDIKQEFLSGIAPITSSIEKAKYAKSHLFDYISVDDTTKIFKTEIFKYIKNKNKKVKTCSLHYHIYENDVKDPGKKTKKSKLYAGYVITQLKNSKGMVIYQNQIDFMDKKGADIANTIRCGVKSLVTYKQ